MANAKLGNYVFDINPSSASWGYSLHTNKIHTYGGVVVQILSSKIDDLVISGYIPLRGGNRIVQFNEMEQFEMEMRQIMESQVNDPPTPIHFSYPELNWDGDVFLMGYDSVTYDIETSAAKYTLRFTIDTGFDGVVNIGGIEGIDNIPDGVGWVRNKYNTPDSAYSYEKIMESIGAILDDIGTFDSLNPPDLYAYLSGRNEVNQAENSDGDTGTPGGYDAATVAEAEKKKDAIVSQFNKSISRSNDVRVGSAALFNPQSPFGAAANTALGISSAISPMVNVGRTLIENAFAAGGKKK